MGYPSSQTEWLPSCATTMNLLKSFGVLTFLLAYADASSSNVFDNELGLAQHKLAASQSVFSNETDGNVVCTLLITVGTVIHANTTLLTRTLWPPGIRAKTQDPSIRRPGPRKGQYLPSLMSLFDFLFYTFCVSTDGLIIT